MILAMIWGPYMWLAVPGLILGIYAQIKLSSTYSHYIEVPVASGLSGEEAARKVLDSAGLVNMPIYEIDGHLTDHYDPTKKALFLSSDNFHNRTLAAVGVAAHEAGHALQHKAAYAWLSLRMMVAPATQIATFAWLGFSILGFFLGGAFVGKFIGVAIGIFVVLTFFQLITLPVEFDASRRAKEQLVRLGLVQAQESKGISAVLNAAAMTYVAAMVATVMDLLQLLLMARDRR